MSKKGKVRKNVVRGIAHVKATQNNTLVTITDMNGETIAWDSAGTIGFKGARKSTPFAATRAGENCGQKVRKLGMSEVEIRIKLEVGAGVHVEQGFDAGGAVAAEIIAAVLNCDFHTHTTLGVMPSLTRRV